MEKKDEAKERRALRIGTRGSLLALRQTELVCEALREAHPEILPEIVEIRTSGDWTPSQGENRLSALAGGKGQFAKEIEEALLSGEIDCGVHSLKDMPSVLPEGLAIDHVLSREDPRDALLLNQDNGEGNDAGLETLPSGAVIGTSSVRRQAMILSLRPDLRVVSLRGNVPTRIEKLRAGQVDAIVLAAAGLSRLGLLDQVSAFLEPALFLPAVCQGIVGIETRRNDRQTRELLDGISSFEASLCAAAERGAMEALGGSCHTPVGAYAVRRGGDLFLRVLAYAPDGLSSWGEDGTAPARDVQAARELGLGVGRRLRPQVPESILETL